MAISIFCGARPLVDLRNGGIPEPRMLSRRSATPRVVRVDAHAKRRVRAFALGLRVERRTIPSPRIEKIHRLPGLRAGRDSQKLHKNDCGRTYKTPSCC